MIAPPSSRYLYLSDADPPVRAGAEGARCPAVVAMSRVAPRTRLALTALAVALIAATGGAYALRDGTPGTHPPEVARAVQVRLALGPDAPPLPADLHPGVLDVYAPRDGDPLWLDPATRDAALGVLASAAADGLDPDALGLPALTERTATAVSDTALAELDLRLTSALLGYADALAAPRADARRLYGLEWTPSRQAPDAARRLTEALPPGALSGPAAVRAWASGLHPPHAGYRALRAVALRETALAADPRDLTIGHALAPGDSGHAVATLVARLAHEAAPVEALTGVPLLLPGRPLGDGGADAGPVLEGVYDAALADAVAQLQRAVGLRATGRVDAATRVWLNRRQADRLPLVRLNLERWRWLPDSLGALHVWVNLPELEVAVREADPAAASGWREVLRTRAIIGARATRTPVFSDTMDTIVFNPTWTIPASILRRKGRPVQRTVVPPGPGNALGRAKFMFPNDHAVYLHDTNARGLFAADARARSAGCVRVGDPRDLAVTLLARTNGWTPDEVDRRMTGPWRLENVTLAQPVLTHLVYLTAAADASGAVRTWPDVYDWDARLARALGDSLSPTPGA